MLVHILTITYISFISVCDWIIFCNPTFNPRDLTVRQVRFHVKLPARWAHASLMTFSKLLCGIACYFSVIITLYFLSIFGVATGIAIVCILLEIKAWPDSEPDSGYWSPEIPSPTFLCYAHFHQPRRHYVKMDWLWAHLQLALGHSTRERPR